MNLSQTVFCLFLTMGLWACQEIQHQEIAQINLEKDLGDLEIFGEGIISTNLYERDIAIAPNGDEIIYTLGDYKQARRCLVQIRKSEGNWSEPEVLNISGKHQDIEPFYAEEGEKLFFASNRPITKGSDRKDYNIWYSNREGANWGEPKPMNDKINSESDEFYPSLSKNGNLYFTSTRKGGIGREDIFVSRVINGAYQEAEVLDTTINTKYYEFNSFINPDENLLIFSSFGRPDGYGGGDLYFSRKLENGEWSEAKNMGEKINSAKLDYCPFIDEERNIFYFTSDRMEVDSNRISEIEKLKSFANSTQNGMGDIYRIGMDKLDLNPQ